MADWRPYKPSKRADTCRWCGQKLRWPTCAFTPDGKYISNPKDRSKQYKKPGDYGDGFFCGLRCGYQYGVAFAKLNN